MSNTDDQLLKNALLSGVFAGVIAVTCTRLIERCGNLGAILTTMPTTIVPASIGLALAAQQRFSNADKAAEGSAMLRNAMFATPPGMLIDAGFLLQWKLWPSRLPESWGSYTRLAATTALSLLFWVKTSLAVVFITGKLSQSMIIVFGLCCLAALVVIGVVSVVKDSNEQQPQEEAETKTTLTTDEQPQGEEATADNDGITWRVLLLRGLLAGTTNTFAVLLSSVSGSVAGLTSTFPSIFITICISLWLSKGPEFLAKSTVGPIMLGSVSVPLYATTFWLVYEMVSERNIVVSVVAAWIFAVTFGSFPAHSLLSRLKSR